MKDAQSKRSFTFARIASGWRRRTLALMRCFLSACWTLFLTWSRPQMAATALTERLLAAKVTAVPIKFKEVTAKIKASLLGAIVVAAALRIAQGASAAGVTVVVAIAPAKIATASAARRRSRRRRRACARCRHVPGATILTVPLRSPRACTECE